jgi:hypothetical protein
MALEGETEETPSPSTHPAPQPCYLTTHLLESYLALFSLPPERERSEAVKTASGCGGKSHFLVTEKELNLLPCFFHFLFIPSSPSTNMKNVFHSKALNDSR